MEAMLEPLECEVVFARSGEEALEKARTTRPDVILLDVMMPGLSGLEVARRLKEDEETRIIPVVMVSAFDAVEDKIRALEAGADDFLAKPAEEPEVRARVQSSFKVKAYYDHLRGYQEELETEVGRRTEQLREAFVRLKSTSLETIYRLARAAEFRDTGTGDHIRRVSRYAASVAREMGLDGAAVEGILCAAPMHDLGKVGIPDSILMKPGKLSPEEWEVMKQHSAIGARILNGSDAEFIRLAESIALTHHEKWDGSGYPEGLKGSDIPIGGRIAAIADVFDALTSERPYKKAFPVENALGIVREGRASHFDPDVVDAFFAVQKDILSIREAGGAVKGHLFDWIQEGGERAGGSQR